jgi:hypothetical protein
MHRYDFLGLLVGDPKVANAKVLGNDISGGDFGIFVTNSHRGYFVANQIHNNCAGLVFAADLPDSAPSGHMVVSRLRIRGTLDRGPFMGFAPDGKEREVSAIVIHRIEGDKIAEEWREGSGVLELTRAALKQEIGERERVEQELQVARRIQQASLPEEVPTLEGWQIAPFYQPAREVGGDFYDFHLLSEGRLACGGGCHGQGGASGACDVHNLRDAAPRSPKLLLARADAPAS